MISVLILKIMKNQVLWSSNYMLYLHNTKKNKEKTRKIETNFFNIFKFQDHSSMNTKDTHTHLVPFYDNSVS